MKHIPPKLCILTALFFAAACSSGCAYITARGLDAADIFNFQFGFGPSLEAHVIIGPVGVGLGEAKLGSSGFYGRQAFWQKEYHITAIPNPDSIAPAEENCNPACCLTAFVPTLKFEGPVKKSYTIILTESDSELDLEDWIYYGEVGVGAAPLLCGVEFGINFIQLADFLLGWTTIDIAGDDPAPPKPASPDEPEKPEEKEIEKGNKDK